VRDGLITIPLHLLFDLVTLNWWVNVIVTPSFEVTGKFIFPCLYFRFFLSGVIIVDVSNDFLLVVSPISMEQELFLVVSRRSALHQNIR
jgi:hypothetical protein